LSDKNLYDLIAENGWITEVLNDGALSQREAAEVINSRLGGEYTSRSSVKRYRAKHPVEKSKPVAADRIFAEAESPAVGSGEMEKEGDEGLIRYTSAFPLDTTEDWAHVFEIFKLNPEEYFIVEDTVRCKTWQQSKALDNGARDIIQLYSYGARFQKKRATSIGEEDINDIVARMWEAKEVAPNDSDETECTFVVCWADLQLGKGENGGVRATSKKFIDALDATERRILSLKAEGRNITKILVANMGDPVEGCDQHYAVQTFTTELNQRDQLLLALNLFSLGLSRLAKHAPEIEFLSVLCNHGEWLRKGNKAFTDDADNASGFIGDVLKMIFEHREDSEKFSWTIPQDEMITTSEVAGVQVAFTHGHKMPQSSDNIKGENQWLQNQSIKVLRDTGSEPRLWVTAHRHHAMVLDFGPWFRIQCSALDGGSKWFTDASGKWATDGVTTFTVGQHDIRGFSDYKIL
jgi:hypothetical protein